MNHDRYKVQRILVTFTQLWWKYIPWLASSSTPTERQGQLGMWGVVRRSTVPEHVGDNLNPSMKGWVALAWKWFCWEAEPENLSPDLILLIECSGWCGLRVGWYLIYEWNKRQSRIRTTSPWLRTSDHSLKQPYYKSYQWTCVKCTCIAQRALMESKAELAFPASYCVLPLCTLFLNLWLLSYKFTTRGTKDSYPGAPGSCVKRIEPPD